MINVKYFAEANAAASRIFEMIMRVPKIDSADQQGKTVSNVKGDLEFKDIDFAYPSRIESLVLKKFSLRVTAGQTVGLVGKSGSGKSTVVNLLERFYNPIRGEIYLDGIDIRSLQLKWLRSQMGLVSQEPILFATTIKENILFGKEEASMEEIIKAAKASNAHNFINQLPNGYDTMVRLKNLFLFFCHVIYSSYKQTLQTTRELPRSVLYALSGWATGNSDVGRTETKDIHCKGIVKGPKNPAAR